MADGHIPPNSIDSTGSQTAQIPVQYEKITPRTSQGPDLALGSSEEGKKTSGRDNFEDLPSAPPTPSDGPPSMTRQDSSDPESRRLSRERVSLNLSPYMKIKK